MLKFRTFVKRKTYRSCFKTKNTCAKCVQGPLSPSVYLGRQNIIHVIKWTRPSPSIFAYCKRLKTGRWEGLGTRLPLYHIHIGSENIFLHSKKGAFWPHTHVAAKCSLLASTLITTLPDCATPLRNYISKQCTPDIPIQAKCPYKL